MSNGELISWSVFFLATVALVLFRSPPWRQWVCARWGHEWVAKDEGARLSVDQCERCETLRWRAVREAAGREP